MATDSYELYVESNMNLVRSLNIKSSYTASSLNAFITNNGVVVDEHDERTWKYYLNLAGEYHPGESMIYVKSSDTQQDIEFTKENLILHPVTSIEYRQGGRFYKDLIKRYPKRKLLIDGITKPIDIDRAIAAKNFTILSWDTQYVSVNEITLISQLQRHIDDTVKRWYNPDFNISDPYYEAAFLICLRHSLVLAVIALRLSNSTTPQVDDFHLWMELSSHYRIDNYRDYLSNDQALWLYRNMTYLRRNAGKDSTMDTLVKQLIEPKKMTVNRFDFVQIEEGMIVTGRPKGRFSETPYKQISSSIEEYNLLTAEELLEAGGDKAISNRVELQSDTVQLEEWGKYSLNSTAPTGIVKVVEDANSSIDGESINQLKLDYWIYLAHLGMLDYQVSFQQPGTDIEYYMNAKDAIILYIFACNMAAGRELEYIPTVEVKNVVRVSPPTRLEMTRYSGGVFTEEDAERALSYYIVPTPIDNLTQLTNFATSIRDMRINHMLQYNERPSANERSIFKDCINTLYRYQTCSMVDQPTRYNDWLAEVNFNKFGVSETDWYLLTTVLLEEALGIYLDYLGLPPDRGAMVEILDRLTSYSLLILEGEGTNGYPVVELLDNLPDPNVSTGLSVANLSFGLQSEVAISETINADKAPTLTNEIVYVQPSVLEFPVDIGLDLVNEEPVIVNLNVITFNLFIDDIEYVISKDI